MHSTPSDHVIFTDEATSVQNEVPASVYRCFLFTDIEGSTGLWERYGESFREALDLHYRTIRAAIQEHGGQELIEAGDGLLVSFADVRPAVECAVAAQSALASCVWPVVSEPLRIRMGLHAGKVEPRENGEYRGVVLNRAARVRDTAHGEQIVCSEEVASALNGVFTCRELGRFRLKGLPNPERLSQVNWPGMPSRTFPAPNAVPAYTHNLPLTPTRFIGRASQIAAIRDLLLEKDGRRLLTLTGPGGTGKTRLALAAAESLLSAFSHAVFFIPLADTEDPAAIPREIIQALRLDPSATVSPEDQIATFFGHEPALLVIDNFEQLADTGASVIQKLLASVPRLRCLITSRRRLSLTGEREFPVPPLAVPEGDVTPEELVAVESVALFVDRAQVARSTFELHERNATAVAELCRRLDGVPLALELAAARADVSTPREILDSLNGRLDALASAESSVPERHRTLRAAIEWSFEFLPPALRDFFSNLSIFRGGWTAEGAESVAAVPGLGEVSANILRALSELRSASLIVAEESGETMRFRMLETLRQYAEEQRKASPEEQAVTIRHRLYYTTLAEAAQRGLHTKDQKAWSDRLEAEHDNFRAILSDTFTDSTGLQIASDLVHFWIIRGYIKEARDHLARHMLQAERASALVRLCAANAAGMLALDVHDYANARVHFEQAVEICRESDNQRNLPGMLANVGLAALNACQWDDAERFLAEALQLYTELGTEERRQAQCLGFLATLANSRNQPALAIELAERALKILRPLEDWNSVSTALRSLALGYFRLRNFEAAQKFFRESFQLVVETGYTDGLAGGLLDSAMMERVHGNVDEAVRLLGANQWIRKQLIDAEQPLSGLNLEVLGNLPSEVPAERYAQLWQEGQLLGKNWLKKLETAKRR